MDNLSKEAGIIAVASIFGVLIAIGIIILLLVYQKRQAQFLREKDQIRATMEKTLLYSQLEIQEQTLKTISQEIHDNIGQTLSLAKLHLGTVQGPDHYTGQQKIEHSRELVSKAILDLRNLSRTLNADMVLSGGLVASIEQELANLERSGLYHTEMLVHGKHRSLDPKKELILFRIVQECLNNIIKHAKASRVSIEAEFDEHFTLKICDNGIGFGKGQKTAGSGLCNMKNRIKLLGGTLSIESGVGKGTILFLTVPMNEHA